MKKLIIILAVLFSVSSFAQTKNEKRKAQIDSIADLRTALGLPNDNTMAVAQEYKGQKDLHPVIGRLEHQLAAQTKSAQTAPAPVATSAPIPASSASSAPTQPQSLSYVQSFQDMYDRAKKDTTSGAKSFMASLKNAGIADRNVKNFRKIDIFIQGWEMQNEKTENGKTVYSWEEFKDQTNAPVFTDGNVYISGFYPRNRPIRKGKFLKDQDQKLYQGVMNAMGVKIKDLDTKLTTRIDNISDELRDDRSDIDKANKKCDDLQQKYDNLLLRVNAIQDTSAKGTGIQAKLTRLTDKVDALASAVNTRSVIGGILFLAALGGMIVLFRSNTRSKEEIQKAIDDFNTLQPQGSNHHEHQQEA